MKTKQDAITALRSLGWSNEQINEALGSNTVPPVEWITKLPHRKPNVWTQRFSPRVEIKGASRVIPMEEPRNLAQELVDMAQELAMGYD